jgi:hypothetical protein
MKSNERFTITVSGPSNRRQSFRWRPILELLEKRETPAIGLSATANWVEQGPTAITAGQANVTGNSTVIGAVQAIATVRTDANISFVGGPNTGVWRTFNATAASPTWTPISDHLASLSISDIAIDPANPNRVIAGIGGSADGSVYGTELTPAAPNIPQVNPQLGNPRGDLIGAIFTTNALDTNPTWRVLGGPLANTTVKNVFVRSNVIIVGTDQGVFRSTDDGLTFLRVPNLPATAVFDMTEDPVALSRFYVAMAGAGGGAPSVWRTDNFGAFWGDITDPLLMKVNATTVNIQLSASTAPASPGGPPVNHRIYVGVVNHFPPGPDTQVPVDAQSSTNVLPYSQAFSARAAQLTSVTYSDNFGGNWYRMDVPRYLGSNVDISLVNQGVVTTATRHRLRTGDMVYLSGNMDDTAPTATPPGPLLINANGVFWVRVTGTNTFTIHTSYDNMLNNVIFTDSGTSDVDADPAVDFGWPGWMQQVHGVNPGENGQFFDLVADPTNTSIVYIGAGRQELASNRRVTEIGGTTFTGHIWRGDASRPAFPPPFGANETFSNQWIPTTNKSNNTFDDPNFPGLPPHNKSKAVFADGPSSGWGSFTTSNTAPAADVRELVVDANGRLIAGTGGGIYARGTPTKTTGDWVSSNGNLGIGQLWSAVYDTATNTFLGGFQDVGAAKQSATGDGTYNEIFSTAQMNTMFDQANSYWVTVDNTGVTGKASVVVVAGSNFGSFFRYENGTAKGSLAFGAPTGGFSGLQTVDNSVLNTAVAQRAENQFIAFNLNNVDPRRGIYGSTFLYEDSDTPNQLTGSVVSHVTPAGKSPTSRFRVIQYGGRLEGVALPQIIYAGTDEGELWVRGQFGVNFVNRAPSGTGPISDVVMDPDDFRHVFVLRGGNKIFESFDEGRTWTDVTSNLVGPATADGTAGPNFQTTQIRTIAIWDPNPGTTSGGVILVAGGRGGVYRSTFDANCNRITWSEYGNALPNTVVQDLQFFGNRLVAGTFGRGIWTIPDVTSTLGSAISLVVTGDANANTITVTQDPNNPSLVTVNDGLGNVQSFTFGQFERIVVNGLAGADTVIIGSNGLNPNSTLEFLDYVVEVNGGGDAGDVAIINGLDSKGGRQVTISGLTVGQGVGDNLFGPCGYVQYSGLDGGGLYVVTGKGNDVVQVRAETLPPLFLNGGSGDDAFRFDVGAKSQVLIYDVAGNDSITLNGTVLVDAFTVTPNSVVSGPLGITYGSTIKNIVLDGNLANDTLTLFGTTGDDNLVVRHHGVGFSVTTGLQAVVTAIGIESETVGGNGGTDKLTWEDRTNTAYGSIADPSGGATYKPTGTESGQWLVGLGGSIAALYFDGIAGEFHANGDGNANGSSDVVTVLATSTTGQPSSYGEITATDGTDYIYASDAYVAIQNATIGQYRPIYFDGGITGKSSFAHILVRTGNEVQSGVGDFAVAVPTLKTNLLIDGGNPTVLPGDTITVNVLGKRNILSVNDPTLGPPQTRIVQQLNQASVGYINFETAQTTDVTPLPPPPGTPPPPTIPVAAQLFAVGTDAGVPAQVRVYNAQTGALLYGPLTPFGGFTGGVRVATGDYNGDGITDIAVGAGPGGGPAVVVYNGATGKQITSFFAFESAFRGGVHLALADVNGDGLSDFIIGAGAGGGPRVKVLSGQGFNTLYDFFAYDPGFRGGVTVAGGDVNNDGRADMVIGTQSGGGPHVKVFNAVTGMEIASFFAYDPGFLGGVYVAAGDVTGDGRADIITGPGVGGGPHVKVFDGVTLQEVRSFFVTETGSTGGPPIVLSSGATVAAIDQDGDGLVDILTGRGAGTKPLAQIYKVSTRTGATVNGFLKNLLTVNTFGDTFGNGIFVG